MDDGGEVRFKPQRVGVTVVSCDVGEHDDHVLANLFVAAPHSCEVEAAALCWILPGQQEVGYATALAGASFRMCDEAR